MKIETEDKLVEYIRNEMYFRVKPSTVHGVGLFAIKDIPDGTDIFIEFKSNTLDDSLPERYHTATIKKNKLKGVHLNVLEMLKDYGVNDEEYQWLYIPHNYKGMHIFFMNHSDNPNGFPFYRDDGSVGFRTSKFIKDGEEIFQNYRLLRGV